MVVCCCERWTLTFKESATEQLANKNHVYCKYDGDHDYVSDEDYGVADEDLRRSRRIGWRGIEEKRRKDLDLRRK